MIITLQMCASTAKVCACHIATAMLETMTIHKLRETMIWYRSIHEKESVTDRVPYRNYILKAHRQETASLVS